MRSTRTHSPACAGFHAAAFNRRHALKVGGHDPLLVTQNPNDPAFALPELSLPADITPGRLQQRREVQKLIDAQTRLLDYSATARGINDYYERAMAMLTSPKLRKAFDLASEPDKVRDRYGRTTYGQSVLLARRQAGDGCGGVKLADCRRSSNGELNA